MPLNGPQPCPQVSHNFSPSLKTGEQRLIVCQRVSMGVRVFGCRQMHSTVFLQSLVESHLSFVVIKVIFVIDLLDHYLSNEHKLLIH